MEPDNNLKFDYYPSLKNAITIYKNSKALYYNGFSKVVPDKNTDFIVTYTGIQTRHRTAHIESPFDKIGIVFKELGINHFIDIPLSHISSFDIDMSFDYFGEQFHIYCNSLFNNLSPEERVSILDHFFEKNFTNFQEERLKKSVALILNSTEKITVKEISGILGIDRKTLLRLFKLHLGCTVKDFIDIARFRSSLNQYLSNADKSSLTKVAIDSNFYDQAQYIHHFKKFTGNNPKNIFRSISRLGEENTFWTFD